VSRSIEDIRLDHAAEFPYGTYHTTGESAAIEDWAQFAALGVLSDLCDRSGLKHLLRDIKDDEDIAQDIIDSLTAIIRRAHERMPPLPEPPADAEGAQALTAEETRRLFEIMKNPPKPTPEAIEMMRKSLALFSEGTEIAQAERAVIEAAMEWDRLRLSGTGVFPISDLCRACAALRQRSAAAKEQG
jgi:hypothetical protein